MSQHAGEAPLLVDGHVHFHSCFDPVTFLDAAAAQFRRHDPAATGALLFTESAGTDAFRRFKTGSMPLGGWRPQLTDEDCSLWLRNGASRLLICAGRQVVTRENLEVLALITERRFPDGRQIEETLDAVANAGAFRVVPWGFGKWTGGRGRRVASLLEDYTAADFALGDNGGRLRFGRRPALFRIAERRGVRILPGSDPLPFRQQQKRPGSYGIRLHGTVADSRPGSELLRLLGDRDRRWERYGHRERLVPFLRNQVAMQLRKRFGAAA